ncbi:hypothetical protein [Streptomyces sp. NBC_01190]|uniref:hypothetical protein n=1 Tax=Streptomyces sp. NBC_01190 TaxID=2903767 RepID=UPI003866F0CB|nr:hypothetical protein OG519_08165 [Streptomyces sp. NBC_01190]
MSSYPPVPLAPSGPAAAPAAATSATAAEASAAAAPLTDPDSLAELIGDCRQMAERWTSPAPKVQAVVPAGSLHGITVPPSSVRAVDGMSEYGD